MRCGRVALSGVAFAALLCSPAGAETLRDALEAAEMEENKAGDAEILARLGVRTALERAYGILREGFPGQRKLVESFFLKRERNDKKGKDDGTKSPDGG